MEMKIEKWMYCYVVDVCFYITNGILLLNLIVINSKAEIYIYSLKPE